MAVDSQDGTRLSTFPDVIATISLDTGLPVSVGHIKEGQNIGVFVIDKSLIPLSSSVKDPSVTGWSLTNAQLIDIAVHGK
jgi:DUF917 family protein